MNWTTAALSTAIKTGIPDDCDIAEGTSVDCNGNTVPDECDVTGEFLAVSPQLSPVDEYLTQSYTISEPPVPVGAVTLAFTAYADFGQDAEQIYVDLNDTLIGSVFVYGQTDCPDEPAEDNLVVTAENFIEVAGDEDVVVYMTPSADVNAGWCDGETYIAVTVTYVTAGTSGDCNGNGVPDECDTAEGTSADCNGNSVPDDCELADGTATDCDSNDVPDSCQEDVDSDGIIDECDNCGKDYNPQQGDQDRDEVGDVCDNCPGTFNPDQADRDGNGLGDLCDAHLDILPGQCPNFVSSLQTGKWLSVAVVGTEAFHARRIDPSSVTLERLDGDGGIVRAMGEDDLYPPVVEDVAGPTDECLCPANSADGIADLVLQFSSREVLRELKLGPGLSPGEVRLGSSRVHAGRHRVRGHRLRGGGWNPARQSKAGESDAVERPCPTALLTNERRPRA